jgi:hypothetical protein
MYQRPSPVDAIPFEDLQMRYNFVNVCTVDIQYRTRCTVYVLSSLQKLYINKDLHTAII